MDEEEGKGANFHQRLSKIRAKIFRNEEAALSLEGFIDALANQHGENSLSSNYHTPNTNLTPSTPTGVRRRRVMASDDSKIEKDLKEYQELLINKEDFKEISTIGKGHFAVVKLVTERNCKYSRYYAMKKMSKGQIAPQRARLERSIMSMAKSDWITSLKFAFQDSKFMYLVMEYCPGGDMRSLLDRNKGRFTEEMTRFYLAELTLAIKALHDMGFIHRDIKPENIVLDRFGHIKLTDFGSADEIASKGHYKHLDCRPVGTPNYVPPEILQCLDDKEQKNLDPRKSDYWSMGVVGYEMITGRTPFSDEHSIVNTYSNIMKNNYSTEISHLSKDLRALLEGLLTSVEKRHGYDQVVRHSFFNTVDWDGLAHSCPPFVPDLKDYCDTSYFNVDRGVSEPNPDLITASKRYDNVIGFTYVGKHPESMRYSRQFGGEDYSDLMSSLRRQNEDLRLKVSKLEREQRRERSVTLQNESSNEFQKLCQKESKELRGTIGKLEKLLDIERKERVVTEKKSLELLTDLKKKWQDREEERVEKIQTVLKKSETKKEKLERELIDANQILQDKEEEISKLKEVKSSLKSKLKECKGKLEQTVERYHDQVQKNQDLKDQSSLLMETEVKSREDEKLDILKTVDEYRQNTHKLEDEIRNLRKELSVMQSVDRDQKETILFLKQEKDLLEEDNERNVKELRKELADKEEQKERLSLKLQSLKEDHEGAQIKLEDKNEKLAELEKLLQKLEAKIKPIDKLSTSFKETHEEIKHLKDELSLKKIDVRLLERRNKELEERLKLRVTMAKEDQEEKKKIEAELKSLNDKIKPLESEHEQSKKALDRSENKVKSLSEELDNLRKEMRELKGKDNERISLKSQLEASQRKVEMLQEKNKEAMKVEQSCESLMTACMEQQDQVNEYEKMLEKLKANLEEATNVKTKLECQVSELSGTSSALRIEKNELKSKLIFTETQLKEIREKHEDIEHLYKKEEENWSSRLNKMSNVKNEQGEALEKLNTQLNVLANNYDRLSDESGALKQQNIELKEELAQHITSIQSLKESNLKLHQINEEAMNKIEWRNAKYADLREKYEVITDEKNRKDNENHVHIDQLKKLIDHLREKNAMLENGGKGKGKKRPNPDSHLNDEYFKMMSISKS